MVTRQGVGAFVAECAPAVPHRLSTSSLAARSPRGDGAAHRHRDRGGRARGGTRVAGELAGSSMPMQAIERRSRAGRPRSTRTSPSIAASPRRPAIRNSVRFLEYLGRFIIPRQTIRVTLGSPKRAAGLPATDPEGAREIVRRSAPTRCAGARRDAPASAQQPQALSEARGRARRRVERDAHADGPDHGSRGRHRFTASRAA